MDYLYGSARMCGFRSHLPRVEDEVEISRLSPLRSEARQGKARSGEAVMHGVHAR